MTALSKEVGIMSRELEEGFMELTTSSKSSREIDAKVLREAG